MEATRSSETSVQFTRSTRRHIPEDGILQMAKSIQIRVSPFLESLNAVDNILKLNNSYFTILQINTFY
jgi:hypothetical protein